MVRVMAAVQFGAKRRLVQRTARGDADTRGQFGVACTEQPDPRSCCTTTPSILPARRLSSDRELLHFVRSPLFTCSPSNWMTGLRE